MAERVKAAHREISDHVKTTRDNTYRRLFKRTLIGLSVTAELALLTMIFSIVSPLASLLFGGGSLSGLLSDPSRTC